MKLAKKISLALTAGMVGFSWMLARRRPPTTDAERLARLEGLFDRFRPRLDDVPGLDARAVAARLDDEDWVIVDVRAEAERAVSMLPGALSAEEYATRGDALRDRAVIAYCTLGVRSGDFARDLRERGVDAHNFEGGILAWTHIGGRLVRDGRDTREVHVYGPSWNLAARSYTPVW